MYINLSVPVDYVYCKPFNCSNKKAGIRLNVTANLCNGQNYTADQIMYIGRENNYRIYTEFFDHEVRYIAVGSGKFVNDFGEFKINTYSVKLGNSSFKDITTISYSETLNFKNVYIFFNNGTTSYFIAKNDDKINESCNFKRVNQNLNKIYDIVSISDSNFRISNDQHSVYNKAEKIFKNRVLTSDGKSFGLSKIASFNYQSSKLKNTDNIFFVDFSNQSPFNGSYLYENRINLTSTLTKDLQFIRPDCNYMNVNPNLKDFFLLPIPLKGHITVTINDDIFTYLIDWSRFHYRSVVNTDYIDAKNRKLNIFGFIPSKLSYDSDKLEYIKQDNESENVILLNDKRLQKGGNCAYWAAETVIYINNNFRKIKNVLKAFDIAEAQLEVASRITNMIDGVKKANNESNVELALTFKKPNNTSNYNVFTSFYWSRKNKIEKERDVWILNNPELTFSVNVTNVEQMILQTQKKVYSKWILINNSDIQYLTEGFFALTKKLNVQKKAKTLELELEMAEDIVLNKVKKHLHSGIIPITSNVNLIEINDANEYDSWYLTEKLWYIVKDGDHNTKVDKSINVSTIKNLLKKKGYIFKRAIENPLEL